MFCNDIKFIQLLNNLIKNVNITINNILKLFLNKQLDLLITINKLFIYFFKTFFKFY